jgi:hypothetical protein
LQPQFRLFVPSTWQEKYGVFTPLNYPMLVNGRTSHTNTMMLLLMQSLVHGLYIAALKIHKFQIYIIAPGESSQLARGCLGSGTMVLMRPLIEVIHRNKESKRDKVYTILKGMLKELSRAGYYTFRNEPAHAERYSLAYTPSKRKAKEVVETVVA